MVVAAVGMAMGVSQGECREQDKGGGERAGGRKAQVGGGHDEILGC